jgi:hypothetical protein
MIQRGSLITAGLDLASDEGTNCVSVKAVNPFGRLELCFEVGVRRAHADGTIRQKDQENGVPVIGAKVVENFFGQNDSERIARPAECHFKHHD